MNKCDKENCDFQVFDGPPYGPICTICGQGVTPEQGNPNAAYYRTLNAVAKEIAKKTAKDPNNVRWGDIIKAMTVAKVAVEQMYRVWMDCWQLNNPYTHQIEDGEHYARERGLIPHEDKTTDNG